MVLGVFSEEYVEKIAKALVKIGVTDAMVVYGINSLSMLPGYMSPHSLS